MRTTALLLALSLCGVSLADEIRLQTAKGALTLKAVALDVVRLDYVPNGIKPTPTPILDPKGLHRARSIGDLKDGKLMTILVDAWVSDREITIQSKDGGTVLKIDRRALEEGKLAIHANEAKPVYGMRGYTVGGTKDPRLVRENGLFRNQGAPVAAATQGDGGSPLAYTALWGVFVDSVDGLFEVKGGDVAFSHGSRKDIEAYVVLNHPKRSIEVATLLTGHPPMFPKWGLGFMNSQWKTDEKEITDIVAQYRRKRIPFDSFIMDFDFKAWGEDNFGEFRWNSTNGPGNVGGNKFPNGQNGGFGKAMAAQGVHLVGIMKPRVLIENTEHKPTKVAEVATPKGWWMPGKKPYNEYFSHRLANDFDFSKPEVRKWYWKQNQNLFDTGISGWWNDEADDDFPSLGFFYMQQALYDGQRSVSNRRVWSLNRNFYAGAQRFAFGTWSGDIGSGFGVMQDQRVRMLVTLNLGQPHWSMDTGGFGGHPSPENYARWMEFASVVPIMRVHGVYGEHRQPWAYGPVAEAAATKAIQFRYSMMPSLYSWERQAYETGVGIARPLFWEFPGDPKSANVIDEWMLGDGLLVAPIVDEGQTSKNIYLPPGTWYDFATGESHTGEVQVKTDAKTWLDTPMFVRAGTILARQEILQYASEKPVKEITLDIWPAMDRLAQFTVYDDDGETYDYEHGRYFSQVVKAIKEGNQVKVTFEKPKGSYKTPLQTYRVRVHGMQGEKTFEAGKAGNLVFGR